MTTEEVISEIISRLEGKEQAVKDKIASLGCPIRTLIKDYDGGFLSNKTILALERNYIFYVNHLYNLSPQEIKYIDGIGKKALKEIELLFNSVGN